MRMSKDKRSAIFLLAILAIIAALTVTIAISLKVDPISETMKNDPVIKILFIHTDDEKNVLSTDISIALVQIRRSHSISLEIQVRFSRASTVLTELMPSTRNLVLMHTEVR